MVSKYNILFSNYLSVRDFVCIHLFERGGSGGDGGHGGSGGGGGTGGKGGHGHWGSRGCSGGPGGEYVLELFFKLYI